jgi:ubiquinone/menaquinone biosynthesis C-methylase UbiE
MIESIGYRWVGGGIFFDDNFNVVFDAYYLPFKNKCFDLVLCISVFEHLENSWKAIDDIRRCTKINGTLLATIAFLQPFHGNSYYHMTFMGVRGLFEKNGFRVTYIKPGGNVLQ